MLAIEAARRAGCQEAVLIDSDGLVTEATHSSLLWVRRGRLEGTPEGHEILPGMTRQHILRLAATIDIPFDATRVTLAELLAADEVILFGTTIEVLPVVESTTSPSAQGRPGPVARRLGAPIAHERELGRLARDRAKHVTCRRNSHDDDDEANDDPFAEHIRRDPLPDAGIRIIVLTDNSRRQMPKALICPLADLITASGGGREPRRLGWRNGPGRSTEARLEGASLPAGAGDDRP